MWIDPRDSGAAQLLERLERRAVPDEERAAVVRARGAARSDEQCRASLGHRTNRERGCHPGKVHVGTEPRQDVGVAVDLRGHDGNAQRLAVLLRQQLRLRRREPCSR